MGDTRICLGELQTAGFAVVRSFLTEEETQGLVDDFEQSPREPNTNYNIRAISPGAKSRIREKLMNAAQAAQRDAGVTVNFQADGTTGGLYFATEGGQGFYWHQDHETYYAYQNNYDYLNFYIPIIKPDPTRSNLSLIPFDRLQHRSPKMFERLRGRGATRLIPRWGKTIVYDDNRGGLCGILSYDVNELAVTPHLGKGDLLLLRGDVIHQTQDSDTQRVAASFRMMDAHGIVRRRTLVQGGMVKSVLMVRNRRDYTQMIQAFNGREEMTLQEFANVQRAIDRTRSVSVPRFLAGLLSERAKYRWTGARGSS